jgi:hypothetical protein
MRHDGAGAHFDEHQGPIAIAADQVDLAGARPRSARDPIIACHQRQPGAPLVVPGAVLGALAVDAAWGLS